MRTTYVVQTAGTILVISAFLAADLAARWLAFTPTSEWVWYVNLEVLAPLRAPLYLLGPAVSSFIASHFMPLALAGLVGAVAALIAKHRLAIAVMANGSAIVVAGITYVWCVGPGAPPQTASLVGAGGYPQPDLALLLVLAAVSILAAAASHVSFIRAIRKDPS